MAGHLVLNVLNWIDTIKREQDKMKKIVECVPNFSEGRNKETIDAIASAIEKTAGVTLLDVDNLTFALLAHSFGVSKIIVKMRDPAYEEAYKIAGVTEICDMIGMIRTRVLTEIEASEIKIIAPLLHGKTQLAMFQVPASWPVEGILVQDMARKKVFFGDCVFAGILNEKSEKIVVPHGQDRVYPGDRIFIVSGAKTLKKISKLLVDEKKASQKRLAGGIKSMRPPI